jgi:cytochrome c-type biogenesis protein CcmH
MQRAPWIAALALTALVPLVAAGLYLALGNPAAITAAGQAPATAAAANQPDRDQINKMVETLAERMRANPEDARGWTLLGRSYAALGRFDDAAHAYAQAAQRAPNDAGIYADWADALGMSQGQTLMGKPTELIDKALALEPTNRKALALAGSAAMDRHDYPAALKYWNTLAANVTPGSEEAKEVAGAIADVQRAQAGGGTAVAGALSVPGAPTTAAGNAAATAGTATAQAAAPPSSVTGAAAATGAGASTRATLRGRVQLAPALAAQAKPDDIVFIYARATQGPRMPLAIIRTTVRELPKDFVLDDSLSMAPGMTLSAFPQVMVEARVAKGGSAIPASGDLAGQAGPLPSSSANVNIVIDRVLP